MGWGSGEESQEVRGTLARGAFPALAKRLTLRRLRSRPTRAGDKCELTWMLSRKILRWRLAPPLPRPFPPFPRPDIYRSRARPGESGGDGWTRAGRGRKSACWLRTSHHTRQPSTTSETHNPPPNHVTLTRTSSKKTTHVILRVLSFFGGVGAVTSGKLNTRA